VNKTEVLRQSQSYSISCNFQLTDVSTTVDSEVTKIDVRYKQRVGMEVLVARGQLAFRRTA
jgi:hypothetical protein